MNFWLKHGKSYQSQYMSWQTNVVWRVGYSKIALTHPCHRHLGSVDFAFLRIKRRYASVARHVTDCPAQPGLP